MSGWNGSDISLILYNKGNLEFEWDEFQDDIIGGTAVQLADIDKDGDLDLICLEGCCVDEKKIYKNDGNGKFIFYSNFHIINSMFTNIDTSDYDRDGDVDFTAGIHEQDASLHVFNNDGNGNFTAIFIDSTLDSKAIFEDVDKDGDDDILLCSNGTLFPGRLILYLNQNGNFIKYVVENSVPTFSYPINNVINAMDVSDADQDGDMDIAAVRFNLEDEFLMSSQQNTLFVFDSLFTLSQKEEWRFLREEKSFLRIFQTDKNLLRVRFYLPVHGNLVLQLYDMTGRKISETKLEHQNPNVIEEINIHLSKMNQGIYLGKLVHLLTGKYVVEKF
ncbi:MAG: hypothetical protein A3H98_08990 [Bacteroidetes bacterium RIFCSPLOWO2_02_FULL_36_8]|nr:MAG: hypothetical protein A3H98_08990 [Bacteroidetes bacterium RIFCSPLOWO2_02_FULL_36_8]OFY70481.1 MAG: hypothetical protein A3G23_10180 [Bacteroidetes bacterium RIFCSPLOWO2_12_FULL_37_12]